MKLSNWGEITRNYLPNCLKLDKIWKSPFLFNNYQQEQYWYFQNKLQEIKKLINEIG